MQRLFTFLITLVFLTLFSACSNNSHSHAAEEDHEHGPDTHTHDEPVAADTAGTYVDSTSAFFDNEAAEGEDHHEGEDADHEHGPETHTHDDDN